MRTAYEIVKSHYDANDRHDVIGMLADIGPDIEWTEMAGFPCAGTYTSREEIIANVFQALGSQFDNYTFKLERLLDAGGDVVGIGDYTATARNTGKSFRARVVHVWSVSGGTIRKFEQFTDTLLVTEALR
jgi:ketosteroid isomerase-like protein